MTSERQEEETAGPGEKANEKRPVDDDQQNDKRTAIVEACRQRDFDRLIRLADSTGGLLTDELRQSAWPMLLGSAESDPPATGENKSWRELPPHSDEEQVQRDVDRAFVFYPHDKSCKTTDARKAKLSDLIVRTLRTYSMLHYFQGYHDIVQVLLLVLGEERAAAAVPRMSLLRIRDYMLPKMDPALRHLQLLPAILQSVDEPLAAHLSQTKPYFALSATLTLYAHDIQEYSDIARLYDFLLAHEPAMSLYLFAAIIVSRRSELLDIPSDEGEMLHFTLSKLPQPLNLEVLISRSLELFNNHPPERLPHLIWWRLSSYSVLKTSRSIQQPQTLDEAELLFEKQAQQLKRDEALRRRIAFLSKHKRSTMSVAAALLVGGVSIWLRRTEQDKFVWSVILWASKCLRWGR